MRELMKDKKWDFEMVSDRVSRSDIKTIDSNLSKIGKRDGGLKWSFVKNLSIFTRRLPITWQKGLLKRLNREDYDAAIF